jgi:predicted phage tail protein
MSELNKNKLTVTCIRNPFDPQNSQYIETFDKVNTLGDVLTKFYPLMSSDFDIALVIDGEIFEGEVINFRSRDISEVSSIVFCAIPHGGGGGGDGKSIFGMVAMIALAVVGSVFVAPAIGFAATAMGFAGASTAIGAAGAALFTMVGGMLISALMPSPSLDTGDIGGYSSSGSSGGLTESPTYGFNPQTNSTQNGNVCPVLYGAYRVTPALINQFISPGNEIDQQYNGLYVLGDHSIPYYYDVLINDAAIRYYQNVTLSYRNGAINQTAISAFGDVKSEQEINRELSSEWETIVTTGNNIQGIHIGFHAPRLFRSKSDGELGDCSIVINAEYRRVGSASWNSLGTITMVGETQTSTRRYLTASNIPEGKYEVRVSREDTTFPSLEEGEKEPSTIQVVDTVYWNQLQEIIYDNFSYPETSLLGVQILASDQISGGRPVISVVIDRGEIEDTQRSDHSGGWSAGYYENKKRISDNVTYLKVWREVEWVPDSSKSLYTEGQQYTNDYAVVSSMTWRYIPAGQPCMRQWDNPAWASYDILTNTEYGGGVKESNLKYSSFLEWSHWCNLRKYFVNVYFDQGVNLAQALQYMGNCGRGMVSMMGTTYTVLIDKPIEVSVQTFMLGEGAMVRDSYSEDYLPVADRANSIEVFYFDKTLEYSRQMVELYDESYDTTNTPINKTSITLIGCTSRDMAISYARYNLLKNKYLTKTVTFTASTDAIGCLPGQVIDIASDTPRVKRSGRILAADATGITLDREVIMDTNKEYSIKLRYIEDDYQELIPIANPGIAEPTTRVEFKNPITKVPGVYSSYHFAETDKMDNMYRVLSITRASDYTRKITAIEYVPEVYADRIPTSIIEAEAETKTVNNVMASETWVLGKDGSGKSNIHVTWDGLAYSWHVCLREYSAEGSVAWRRMATVYDKEYDITTPLVLGNRYEVGVTLSDIPSPQNVVTLTIQGKLAPPSDVQDFQAQVQGDLILLSWSHIPDIDLRGYTIKWGNTWEKGTIIKDTIRENSTTWAPPDNRLYRFWIKASDTSRAESITAATDIVTYQMTLPLNVVISHDEVDDNIEINTYHNLVLHDSKAYWIPPLTDTDEAVATLTDTSPGISQYAGESDDGYILTSAYDLGVDDTPYTIRMAAYFDSEAVNVTDLSYPMRTDLTYPLDTDISITSNSTYVLYYRTSSDGITWGSWKKYTALTDAVSRYIQYRYNTLVDSPSVSFYFDSCTNTLDVPDRDYVLYDQTIPAEGRTYVLEDENITFSTKYSVFATVTSFGTLFPDLVKTGTGFTISLVTLTGTPTEGTVDIRLRGF